MKKYLVEFGFGENVISVEEWQAVDGMKSIEAENAEEAAKEVACTDGLEDALFRVYELAQDDFGGFEKAGEPEYFEF